jgi:Flp pilus assembly protein TadD
MKRLLQIALAAAVTVLLCASASATLFVPAINGVCIDEHGQPCNNVSLKFVEPLTGRNFTLRTDSQGKFYHPAAEPGDYALTARRQGQPDVELPPVGVTFSALPLILTVDLANHTAHLGRQTLSVESFSTHGPISIGSESEVQNPFAKEIAGEFERGDWEAAIRTLKTAVHHNPDRPGLHAMLGYAYYEGSKKNSGMAEEYLKGCVEEYSSAIALKPEPRYYNNLGTAYVRIRHYDDAVKQFQTAETLFPAKALLYERNIGVTLVGQSYDLPETESVAALQRASDSFTRVLAAEPQNEDVLYWKGVALLKLASVKPDSANYDELSSLFQRYLQVSPNGRFAKEVHGMLASIPALQHPQNQQNQQNR